MLVSVLVQAFQKKKVPVHYKVLVQASTSLKVFLTGLVQGPASLKVFRTVRVQGAASLKVLGPPGCPPALGHWSSSRPNFWSRNKSRERWLQLVKSHPQSPTIYFFEKKTGLVVWDLGPFYILNSDFNSSMDL
jgi:hypothetical protein